MSDIVSSEKRSAMMAGIRGRDTKPELAVRRALFAQGFRYRLHYKKLPGNPDIVLPKHRIAIFVHGCFWHMHTQCKLSKLPSSRPDFWLAKLNANAARDLKATEQLLQSGWRVLVIWECYLRSKKSSVNLQSKLTDWILGAATYGSLPVIDESALTSE